MTYILPVKRTITLQALNPTTKIWEIRAAFVTENHKLNASIETHVSSDIVEDIADKIKAAARVLLTTWRNHYLDGRELRVHDTAREPAARSLGADLR